MMQLILTIHAFGYKGDDYEEQDVSNKKSIDKDTASDQLTETDCTSLIEEMIQSVQEMKKQFPDERNTLNNKLVFIEFTITSENDAAVYDEENFFNKAATHDSLSNLIQEYINVTDHGDEGTRIAMPENDAYESHPAGTFAALALVAQDKKWIYNYIDFLRTNDLDHEMMQVWHIKRIVEKYGWCEQTSKLAIARVVSCCGQGGKEQFNSFVKKGLFEYVSESGNRKMFLQNILKEFDEWDKLEFRLKDGSETYYQSYIVSYAKHFEGLLSKAEIEEIETYLMNKWYAYNPKSK